MTNSTVHLMASNPRKNEFIGAAPCWCGHRKHNPKLWRNTVCILSFMAVVDAIKRNEWKGIRESNWFPKRDPWITSWWRKGLSPTEPTQERILTQTPGEERYPPLHPIPWTVDTQAAPCLHPTVALGVRAVSPYNIQVFSVNIKPHCTL